MDIKVVSTVIFFWGIFSGFLSLLIHTTTKKNVRVVDWRFKFIIFMCMWVLWSIITLFLARDEVEKFVYGLDRGNTELHDMIYNK